MIYIDDDDMEQLISDLYQVWEWMSDNTFLNREEKCAAIERIHNVLPVNYSKHRGKALYRGIAFVDPSDAEATVKNGLRNIYSCESWTSDANKADEFIQNGEVGFLIERKFDPKDCFLYMDNIGSYLNKVSLKEHSEKLREEYKSLAMGIPRKVDRLRESEYIMRSQPVKKNEIVEILTASDFLFSERNKIPTIIKLFNDVGFIPSAKERYGILYLNMRNGKAIDFEKH